MPSFFLMSRRPPRSPLFPSTTLFRSRRGRPHPRGKGARLRRGPALLFPARERRDRKSTRLNSTHSQISYAVFFFNEPAPTEISSLSLHDALPISPWPATSTRKRSSSATGAGAAISCPRAERSEEHTSELHSQSNLVCRLFF